MEPSQPPGRAAGAAGTVPEPGSRDPGRPRGGPGGSRASPFLSLPQAPRACVSAWERQRQKLLQLGPPSRLPSVRGGLWGFLTSTEPRLLAHSPFPLLLFQDPGRHVDSLGTRERRERVCEWERFGIFGIFPVCEWERFGIFGIFPVCEWERFGIFVIFPLTPLIKLPCFHSICASNPVPQDQKEGLLAGRATAAWMESSLQLAFLAFISAPAA